MTEETPNPEQSEDVEARRKDVAARRKQGSAPAEDVEGHARPFVDPPGRVDGDDALNER